MNVSLARSLLPTVFVLALAARDPLRAENWNGWRGPRGDGTSREEKVPVHWDGTEETRRNILWEIELPGAGHASPIFWDERLFLVSCRKETEERLLLCLDRESGKTLWERTVLRSPLETRHSLNSYASSTPATDGRSVFVTFLEVDGSTVPAPNVSNRRAVTPGRIVVACYDFRGERKWVARPGEFISVHGFCSSPVLYEDLVIVNGDHDGDGYIVALDRDSGRTRWKVDRANRTRSYVTPIIREIDGRRQLILSGSKCVASYDPRNGKQHWWIDGPTEQFVASLVYDGKLLYMTAGFPERHILAIRPDGSGNVTDTHVVWRTNRGAAYVPSPIVVGPYFLVVSDKGIASCFDGASGKRHWMERIGSGYSASLVSAGGLVYFLSDRGVMTVVRPGIEFDRVATNEIGERCSASPAIAAGRMYIRGERHLYAIGKAASSSAKKAGPAR